MKCLLFIHPYLTETLGDILFERKEGKPTNLNNYYLTDMMAKSKYAPINPDYISVAELNQLYEPKDEYMSQNILSKHMEEVSEGIIDAQRKLIPQRPGTTS